MGVHRFRFIRLVFPTMLSLCLSALLSSASASTSLGSLRHFQQPVSSDAIAHLHSDLASERLQRLSGGFFGREKADMVLVGCGVPKRGMGWYHGVQLLNGQIPSGKLSAVVEPFFMGAGKDLPPGKAFAEFKTETEKKHGTEFYANLADWSPKKEATCVLIAGRTADNPRIFKELVAKGVKHIYLEKPGAPTVGELEEMSKLAKAQGVSVYVGFNKNVCKYVAEAKKFADKTPGATTTYIHNNAYKTEELAECFERNAEGMLKNMAIHELALLVTFHCVKASNIAEVIPDKEYSDLQTHGKYTDFAKAGFTLKLTDGSQVSVKANRCGGSYSNAVVSVVGVQKFRSVTPDKALEAKCKKQQAADPKMMPYFFLQHDDYITLKERVCAHILSGKEGSPEGIATIDIAVEALKVAEYLTPLMKKMLK